MCLENVYLIYVYKKDWTLITYNSWYVIKPNQTKPNQNQTITFLVLLYTWSEN